MDALSTLAFLLLFIPAAPAPGECHQPSVSFAIIHRDAPRSAIRSAAADTSDLPPDMPMKDFIGFGRGLQARRRSLGHGRHTLHPAAAGDVKGSFSYARELVGDFYLTAMVGTPPQKIIFILDTGSELIWTRCLPCSLCTPSNAPVFRPNQSSSYVRVPCHSPLCEQSTGLSASCSNSTAKSCIFLSSYADGTVNAGYMSVEKFGAGTSSLDIVFGCSVIVKDAFISLPSSGIIGLNPGPFSFVQQLAGKGYARKFSYCAPGRLSGTNSSGRITFGETKLGQAASPLVYTPLVPRYAALGNLYYYVQVTAITVGNRYLPIPYSAFSTNVTGSGGVVLDSGTTVTHLVDAAYDPLVSALINATAHLHPFSLPTEGAEVCYKIPSQANHLPTLPTIAFHFLYGATLELGSESILYPAALVGDKIIMCLAFLRSSHVQGLSLNIIGNYQQQNYVIEYDLPGSRVGFAKANCAED